MPPAFEMHALGILAREQVGGELHISRTRAEALEMRLAAGGEFGLFALDPAIRASQLSMSEPPNFQSAFWPATINSGRRPQHSCIFKRPEHLRRTILCHGAGKGAIDQPHHLVPAERSSWGRTTHGLQQHQCRTGVLFRNGAFAHGDLMERGFGIRHAVSVRQLKVIQLISWRRLLVLLRVQKVRNSITGRSAATAPAALACSATRWADRGPRINVPQRLRPTRRSCGLRQSVTG